MTHHAKNVFLWACRGCPEHLSLVANQNFNDGRKVSARFTDSDKFKGVDMEFLVHVKVVTHPGNDIFRHLVLMPEFINGYFLYHCWWLMTSSRSVIKFAW